MINLAREKAIIRPTFRNLSGRRHIPCAECAAVRFCSSRCKEEAGKSFHRYECPPKSLLMELCLKTVSG